MFGRHIFLDKFGRDSYFRKAQPDARIAQLDRALASGAKGRRFESCCAYQRWAINSVVECHLHTVEVTGSNPVSPTIFLWPYLLS